MKINKKSFIAMMAIVFIVGTLAGAGVSRFGGFSGVKLSQEDYEEYQQYKDRFEKANKLWNIVDEGYYEDVKEDDIRDGIYRGLFDGLGDEYSGYMTKEEFESYEATVMGEFQGVGITFSEDKNGRFIVIETVEDSPAEKAGVKAGDIITKVDGKKYDDSDKAAAAMRGKKGTKVTVTVKRDDKERDFELTRDDIVVKTVSNKVLDGNIGYIKITAFEDKTDEDFKKALSDMESKNVKGVIIDLRNNGGGLVDSGTNVADMLLGKGTITYMENKNGKKEYYKSDADKTKLDYVLLVNEYSASATEIITAAVKDEGQGKIVGTKTYGKGVVQISDKLDDGSGYKLTIMQYYSPKGNKIHKKGIEPDYEVKGEKEQLNKAIELLK